jgi:hypothetical protein
MALGGVMKPFTRSNTLSEAGVMESALVREMKRHGSQVGVKVDPATGQITNFNQGLAHLVGMRTPPSVFTGRETGPAIEAIKQAANVTSGDTPQQIEAKVNEMLSKFDSMGISMEQFKKDTDDSVSTSDQLRTAFNQISNALEVDLLNVLKDPSFKVGFQQTVDILKQQGPLLGKALMDMIGVFNGAVPVLKLVFGELSDLEKQFKSVIKITDALAHPVTGTGNLLKNFIDPGSGQSIIDPNDKSLRPESKKGGGAGTAHTATSQGGSAGGSATGSDTGAIQLAKTDTTNSILGQIRDNIKNLNPHPPAPTPAK